jgi:poly-beta-hydroxybutyrate-responsive repressor
MGKLSRLIEPVVILAIKEHPRVHGYELVHHAQKLAMTDSEIEAGAVYRALRQLENAGMVTSTWDTSGPGPARRRYSLTEEGETHLLEWAQLIEKRQQEMGRFLDEFRLTEEPAWHPAG